MKTFFRNMGEFIGACCRILFLGEDETDILSDRTRWQGTKGRQGKTQFILPFDRRQLADYLSVERSAMSAELSKMQREGLLIRDRSVIPLHKK